MRFTHSLGSVLSVAFEAVECVILDLVSFTTLLPLIVLLFTSVLVSAVRAGYYLRGQLLSTPPIVSSFEITHTCLPS